MDWLSYASFGVSALTCLLVVIIPNIQKLGITTRTKYEKENNIKIQAEKEKELEQRQVRAELSDLYNLCQSKGYKSSAETGEFYRLYDHYKKDLNGNSWAEYIRDSFDEIPNSEDFSKRKRKNTRRAK